VFVPFTFLTTDLLFIIDMDGMLTAEREIGLHLFLNDFGG
jgi:hypothetical protein